VIAAYDEQDGVGTQVRAVRAVLQAHGMPHEIIVVDDGSRDDTAQEAIRAGARVLSHAHNRGYGAALKTGILAARYEAIAITDADGTYPADQIPGLLADLRTADMVVGARLGERVHIPWARRPGKVILGWLATRIAGQPIPDLNSGLRVFRRECALQYFPVLANRFSFTSTITLAFLADDYQIAYRPIDYHPRTGTSKIAPRHFLDFTILVVRMAMLFQPLKVFVPLVWVFGLLGAMKFAFDINAAVRRHGGWAWTLVFDPLMSTSALLLFLAAFQLLLIGMMADGVIRRIAHHGQPRALSRGTVVVERAADRPTTEAPPGS
jgi:glycosyltransferase involved in cell wall biosynthesis